MGIQKYIKQPISGTPAQYADLELRKVEQSNASYFDALEELFNMALQVETGTFVLTLTGLTTTVQVTARYAKAGSIVALRIPAAVGVSNANTFKLTGLPTALIPVETQGKQWVQVLDNGVQENGSANLSNTGEIELIDASFSGTGWTASGNKGYATFNYIYILN